MIVRYYYQSKLQGSWHKCTDEQDCIQMANMGFQVRKVEYENPPLSKKKQKKFRLTKKQRKKARKRMQAGRNHSGLGGKRHWQRP